MIFTGKQLEHLRFMAERLLFDLEERMSKFQYTKEQKVGVICGHLQEVCSIARAIALDEVCSTPWECIMQPVYTSARETEAVMNHLSSGGWELHMAIPGWLIWRRRKVVREIEKPLEVVNDV